MKLHSPKFERVLRRGVRKAVRNSPELKRESRAANKRRRQYSGMLLLRPGVSLGFAALVWQVAEKTGHLASALALINLWAFLFIFIHAQRLLVCIYRSTDLPALMVLPITEAAVFEWELQKSVRGALWSLIDLFGGCVALAHWSRLPATKWAALIPISVGTWAVVIALAALCAAHLPRLPYQLASGIFFVGGSVLFVARDLVAGPVVVLIDRSAPGLNLVLPTGWPVSAFQLLLPGGRWSNLSLLIPAAALVWTLRNSLARLRTNYVFVDSVLPEAPDLLPDGAADETAVEGAAPDRVPRVGPTAIEDMVRTRRFLVAPPWQRGGWFEALLWKWLSQRERLLADFVFPNGLCITGPWKQILRNLAIVCLAAVTTGYVNHAWAFWIAILGLFVTSCQSCARVFTTGRAFQLVNCGGVNIPLYAGFAIGFRELSRLLVKLSLVQLPLILPLAAVSSLLMFYLLNISLVEGAWFGLKVGGLLLASRFIFIVLSFSSGTNDTTRFRLRSALLLLFVVVSCLGFVALATASFLVPHPFISGLLWGLAAFDAYIFFRGYGWCYHRSHFDLMSLPRA